jgi:hypothetical protein
MKKNILGKVLSSFLFLLLASTILISINIQNVQGQLAAQQPISGPLPSGVTVDNTLDTKAFISFRPNPVGLNQPFLVNIWTSPSIHVDRFQPNYQVTITKPDGTKDIIKKDSYCADCSTWFEYIADQVGTWKIKFDFLGTYYPAGNYSKGYIYANSTGSPLGSAYYKPSSTEEETLIVQDQQVASWPISPLPTGYWTRPISPEYREWWTIAGNFPWFGPGGGPTWDQLYPNTSTYRMGISREPLARFAPWVQAPNSAHVVWERQNNFAGIVGGDNGQQTLEGSAGYPSIILFGRAYQAVSKVNPNSSASATYWQCYDIRTGAMFWERPLYPGETAPTLIEYTTSSSEVPGSGTNPTQPLLLSIGSNYLRKYNAWTGALSGNFSIAPLTNAKYYMNGYVLSVQDLGSAAGANRYRLINWTTIGSATTLSSRIANNITWPWADLGNTQDFGTGIAVYAARPEAGNAFTGTELRAASLLTGKELWNFTTPKIETSSGAVLVEGGKLAMGVLEDRQWVCWDAATGKQLWTSDPTTYPWGDFWSYSSESAYGMIYSGTYEALYAFNWTDGKIVWKFEALANPYETPYTDINGSTVYSWHSSLYVADGKIFTYNSEHTPNQPIARGWKWFAINATTGAEIWNFPGSGVDSRIFQGAMADGYLAIDDHYTGTMFVIGKGMSSTTITAPDIVSPQGSSIVLKGTVLDLSPAQVGTPCVSKDSMSTWMAYLHKQWPIDGFTHNETITGIPISIDATDPNGNPIHIADVTTDGYSGTFGYTWQPDIAGQYKVTATFMGDDSYGSSFATTYASIGAPAATPTVTSSANQIDVTTPIATYVIAGVIAIIIAVAIVGALIMLAIRRKP